MHNTPGTFQQTVGVILSLVKWRFTLIYLERIVIFLQTAKKQIKHVHTILFLLHRAGYKLNLKKCKCFTEKIERLGHVIRSCPLELASSTKDAIQDLKNTTNVNGTEVILGITNVFRCFVPSFARIAAPLSAQLKSGNLDDLDTCRLTKTKNSKHYSRILWPSQCLHCVKVRAISCCTLMRTIKIGCVLMQDQKNGAKNPLGFCTIVYWGRIKLWHDASWMSSCPLGHPSPDTLSWRAKIHHSYRLWYIEIESQTRQGDWITGQVETPFLWSRFWCSTQSGNKKPRGRCIIVTWKRGTGRIFIEDNILISGVASPAHQPPER